MYITRLARDLVASGYGTASCCMNRLPPSRVKSRQNGRAVFGGQGLEKQDVGLGCVVRKADSAKKKTTQVTPKKAKANPLRH